MPSPDRDAHADRPSLGVVVLGFKDEPAVHACLESLRASIIEAGVVAAAVVVANDGETYSLPDDIRQVPVAWNAGYGFAMNAGAAFVGRADYLLFVTQDCRFSVDAIGLMLGKMGTSPEIGVLGPSLLSTARSDGSSTWIRGNRLSRVSWRQLQADAHHPATWLDGACLLVRQQAFAEAGGFSNAYWLYYEDVDFCLRVARHGWQIALAEEAVVTETSGQSTLYLRTRNRVLLVHRLGPAGTRLVTKGWVYCRAAVAYARGDGESAEQLRRGIRDALKGVRT